MKNIFLHTLYEKLIKINDSPQKIALGFSLGVFLGILPGVGPVAALILAALFKVNRMAALTGSLLTNTWISIVTFVLAVKIGSFLTGADWLGVYSQCKVLVENFHWKNLWNISLVKILHPVLIGYSVIGIGLALGTYIFALVILKKPKATRPGV